MSDLRSLIDKINSISMVVEAKGHLDHPEDLVFLDVSPAEGAKRALKAILDTAKNPKTITIKWDGYPALIFGRGTTGNFSIMDKHMFNKKDGTGKAVYSPKQFQEYDASRGVDRSNLHQLINEIWPGLEQASSGSKGYYWGDLLFSQPLQPIDGLYRFRANPNGITYTVDPNSSIGKLLTNKVAGIVVHQYLAPAAITTDEAQSLNGGIGKLKNNSNVAIVPSAMPITPAVKVDSALVSKVKEAISNYGADVDALMTNAPQARNTFNQLFTTYINKKIVSGNLNNLVAEFIDYVATRPMSPAMKEKIQSYLEANKNGIAGAFMIWSAIYQLKMDVVHQLNRAAAKSPVQGYLQDGTATQEGFVAQGLKFVDRLGFSRQNLAGR